MPEYIPFELFSAHHLTTILIVLLIVLGVGFYARGKSQIAVKRIGQGISALIFMHIIVQAVATIAGHKPWVEAIPLHMCDVSLICMAVYLTRGGRGFFNCGFFWGIGGASMAFLTPTLDYNFPHIDYIFFYYSHGLILLGVFYASIALKERPYWPDVIQVIKISLAMTAIIYVINIFLGDGANFWFLIDRPEQASLLSFFPNPPYHLVVLVPFAVMLVILLYLPFYLWDLTVNRVKTI